MLVYVNGVYLYSFFYLSYIVNWSSPKSSALTESSSEIGLLTLARNKRTPHSIKALGPKPFAAQLDLYLLMGLNPIFIFIPLDFKKNKHNPMLNQCYPYAATLPPNIYAQKLSWIPPHFLGKLVPL